jgi:hypothetical protein
MWSKSVWNRYPKYLLKGRIRFPHSVSGARAILRVATDSTLRVAGTGRIYILKKYILSHAPVSFQRLFFWCSYAVVGHLATTERAITMLADRLAIIQKYLQYDSGANSALVCMWTPKINMMLGPF